jgi:hypothetical protein
MQQVRHMCRAGCITTNFMLARAMRREGVRRHSSFLRTLIDFGDIYARPKTQ